MNNDETLRFNGGDHGGTEFGYKPKASPTPEERGHKPASPLDASKPPQGKGSTPQPKKE